MSATKAKPDSSPSSKVRRLRIELGQTQQDVVDRALRNNRVSRTFYQADVGKAELVKPIGLHNERVRVGFAAGLGLSLDDFDAYLDDKLTLRQVIGRSKIRPKPDKVAKMKESVARRLANSRELRFPHLSATLKWRADLDPDFLRAFEEWAVSAGQDYSRSIWGLHIIAQFERWQKGEVFEPPDTSMEGQHRTRDLLPKGGEA